MSKLTKFKQWVKSVVAAVKTYVYKRRCASFKFVMKPHEILDRYVIFKGLMYRVQFTAEGVSIQDQNNNFVDCQLTRLQVLKQLT